MLPLTIIALALFVPGSHGFAIRPATQLMRGAAPTRPEPLRVLPESVASPEDARAYFALWFFGGSGGAGVALRQVPALFEKIQQRNSMSDEGPTQGGDTVGISPLCLYPRDLSRADLAKVVGNKLSVTKMVATGPKPNYMSENGYLCFQSFEAANTGSNPLTVRAVFDAMSTGDNVAPDVAQACLDSFAGDTSSDGTVFKQALLKTKLIGYSSVAFLLFLLGPIVGATCLEAGSVGWFPEWPGNDNLPWSLLVGPGFWTISEYWT